MLVSINLMSINQGFAQRLKELRQQKGLSQTELGNKAEVHYTHISKYERADSSPSLETVILLADCLGVTLDYLVKGSQDDVAVASLNDKDLLRMFEEAEKLPDDEKEAMKKFLDAFILKQKFKEQLAV